MKDLRRLVTRQGETEPPFDNEYWDEHRQGLYVDVDSGLPLFLSSAKFDSGSGWPSFDRPVDELFIRQREDLSHGMRRVEISAADSGNHLGHLFSDGPKTTGSRYCLNSAALRFIPMDRLEAEGYGAYRFLLENSQARHAIIAAGCFWGVQAYFRLLPGVEESLVGYTGGSSERPSYQEVCSGQSGHAEAVRIRFNPRIIDYPQILKHFFGMHDPYSLNRQGNDLGSQYRSAIFFLCPEQRGVAQGLIADIQKAQAVAGAGRRIVTQLRPASAFWPAEDYHQDYLEKHPGGYCHVDLGPARNAARDNR